MTLGSVCQNGLMRVLVPDRPAFHALAARGALHVPETQIDFYTAQHVPPQAQGVVTWLTTGQQREALSQVAGLEWALTLTAGIDHLQGYLPDGVRLYKAPGLHAATVALHILAGMLNVTRGFHLYRDSQQQRQWGRKVSLGSLSDRKVLIWGHGQIGRILQQHLQAFGANVYGINSKTPPDLLEYRLPEVDWVVLLLPSTPNTRQIINAQRLATLKRGAWLYNAGRGDLIVTDDLIAALDDGHLAGAVLDVTDPEPLPAEHLLWSFENVVITPHIASTTDDLMARGAVYVRNFLLDLTQGRELDGLVGRSDFY